MSFFCIPMIKCFTPPSMWCLLCMEKLLALGQKGGGRFPLSPSLIPQCALTLRNFRYLIEKNIRTMISANSFLLKIWSPQPLPPIVFCRGCPPPTELLANFLIFLFPTHGGRGKHSFHPLWLALYRYPTHQAKGDQADCRSYITNNSFEIHKYCS